MSTQNVSAERSCLTVLSLCGLRQDGKSKRWARNCELRNHGQLM
jgi:hypothetical protein